MAGSCCDTNDKNSATHAGMDMLRVALVGTPNCGKTALFNALTGSRQKVANYSGVTVERKSSELRLAIGETIELLDLPGTLGLRARSPDERITRDVVLGRQAGEKRPHAILCVGDATNLRPTLRLVMELRLTGIPVLLVINMMDIARARGQEICLERLEGLLGVPVVESVAVRRGGITQLMKTIEQSYLVWRQYALTQGTSPSQWQEPDTKQLRHWHAEADKIYHTTLITPCSPPTLTNRIDRIALHPVWGLLILFGVLFLMFQAVFSWASPLTDLIDLGLKGAEQMVTAYLEAGWLRNLIVDGVIAGVGSVLAFLPQIAILFLFIIFLEDFGYMARAAFLLDRLMGGVGLHGRAFIPLLSSFACAIPGIMAARTIENRRDRMMTIMIAPFMTCSARLPVYTLVIAAMIPNIKLYGFIGAQGLVMFALYAMGIVAGLLAAFILKRFVFRHEYEPLLLNLPDYKFPTWKNLTMGISQRSWMFVKRAGTVIFMMMVVLWFLASYPAPPPGAEGPAIDYSFAGMLGHVLAPLMAPIGFNWQMTLALLPSMAAREVAVATLGTIYAVSGSGDVVSASLGNVLHQAWTVPSALAFLVWFVFAPQCISTLTVVKRETGRWKWPLVMFTYMTAIAYIAAYVTYHVAGLFWA